MNHKWLGWIGVRSPEIQEMSITKAIVETPIKHPQDMSPSFIYEAGLGKKLAYSLGGPH